MQDSEIGTGDGNHISRVMPESTLNWLVRRFKELTKDLVRPEERLLKGLMFTVIGNGKLRNSEFVIHQQDIESRKQ